MSTKLVSTGTTRLFTISPASWGDRLLTRNRIDDYSGSGRSRRQYGHSRHRPWYITYLPVNSPGARLFIGDAHACQGDGEMCGNGVEIASETTIHVDLIKGWQISWP